MSDLNEMEATLRALLHGEFSSLAISFNDEHAPNYATAQKWHDEWGEYGGGAPNQRIDWVSEDERQKALATNSVWTCQWYPNTPVGFNCMGAASLAALMDGLRAYLQEQRS